VIKSEGIEEIPTVADGNGGERARVKWVCYTGV
jgi:hypothetical protein